MPSAWILLTSSASAEKTASPRVALKNNASLELKMRANTRQRLALPFEKCCTNNLARSVSIKNRYEELILAKNVSRKIFLDGGIELSERV